MDGDGNQLPSFLIKEKPGGGGGRANTPPVDEKNALQSNRLGGAHFQVPGASTPSIDNARCSDRRRSVIENKIDTNCIRRIFESCILKASGETKDKAPLFLGTCKLLKSS